MRIEFISPATAKIAQAWSVAEVLRAVVEEIGAKPVAVTVAAGLAG
jgi:glycogen debranching enzyme